MTRDQMLADQAQLYGQVDNATWFAERIAEYQRAGNQQMVAATLAIAERHNIPVPCGKQVRS